MLLSLSFTHTLVHWGLFGLQKGTHFIGQNDCSNQIALLSRHVCFPIMKAAVISNDTFNVTSHQNKYVSLTGSSLFSPCKYRCLFQPVLILLASVSQCPDAGGWEAGDWPSAVWLHLPGVIRSGLWAAAELLRGGTGFFQQSWPCPHRPYPGNRSSLVFHSLFFLISDT